MHIGWSLKTLSPWMPIRLLPATLRPPDRREKINLHAKIASERFIFFYGRDKRP